MNADCNTPIGYIVHLEGGEEGLPWERATMSCVRSCDAGNCPCDPKVPDHIVGQAECCTKDKPCKEQHGDCDKDEDCEVKLWKSKLYYSSFLASLSNTCFNYIISYVYW